MQYRCQLGLQFSQELSIARSLIDSHMWLLAGLGRSAFKLLQALGRINFLVAEGPCPPGLAAVV